jgi:hypothetical protein
MFCFGPSCAVQTALAKKINDGKSYLIISLKKGNMKGFPDVKSLKSNFGDFYGKGDTKLL